MNWVHRFIFRVIILVVVSGCVGEPSLTATKLPSTVKPASQSRTQIELPTATQFRMTDTPELPTPTLVSESATPVALKITSPAFNSGDMIPEKFSYKGDNVSPPLEWIDPPEGTESFALILYSDPLKDGGGNWVHWILYNIPVETRSLPEGIKPDPNGNLPDGSRHFKNSWEKLEYGGPNPQHVYLFKYYFEIYALDTTLDLESEEKRMLEAGTLPWIGPSREVLIQAMDGHILAKGLMIGKYKEDN